MLLDGHFLSANNIDALLSLADATPAQVVDGTLAVGTLNGRDGRGEVIKVEGEALDAITTDGTGGKVSLEACDGAGSLREEAHSVACYILAAKLRRINGTAKSSASFCTKQSVLKR